MSSPLTFIPRKVAKKAVVTKPFSTTHTKNSSQGVDAHVQGVDNVVPRFSTSDVSVNPSKDKGKARENIKTKISEEDYANLTCIALSDYALWSDSNLRQKIDFSVLDEGKGFIPLSYLLQRSQVFSSLRLRDDAQTQAAIVKALRSRASSVVEVRLLVTPPSNSSAASYKRSLGGYEVRRVNTGSLARSKMEWDKQTLYMENIPVQYRSIPGILKLTMALLPTSKSQTSSMGASPASSTRIENITLPHHHLDKPGDPPTCKNFALITLTNHEDHEYLLNTWPWDRTETTDTKFDSQSEESKEARKFGFRTLPKIKWEELKSEYLAYRQRLVDDINLLQDTETDIGTTSNSHESHANKVSQDVERQLLPETTTVPLIVEHSTIITLPTPTFDSTSPYPYNCLVFAKNVHPETNKTTLKALFGRAFMCDVDEPLKGGAPDYVDFNKGMDTCHLRLRSPLHAEHLVRYFSQRHSIQATGLDDSGSSALECAAKNAISVELVQGKREEIYWNKVPDKIRRKAVEEAISFMQTGHEANGSSGDSGSGREQVDRDSVPRLPRRKRQKY